jgi:hypothetical protein
MFKLKYECLSYITFKSWEQKMGFMGTSQNNPPSTPLIVFPSKIRRYVRLTVQQAYESTIHLLSEVSKPREIETKQGEILAAKARLDGQLGAIMTLSVFPEGDVSALDFAFSYRRLMYAMLGIVAIVIALIFILQNIIPILGLVLIVPLAYNANNSAVRFLDSVNEALPFIEKELAHKALMANRERWEAQPKDTEALYIRLSEKHIKTWGNTKVLEYKVKEYEALGLTRNEAIRKIAEEEGVN